MSFYAERAGVADVLKSFVALVQNCTQGSLINHSALAFNSTSCVLDVFRY